MKKFWLSYLVLIAILSYSKMEPGRNEALPTMGLLLIGGIILPLPAILIALFEKTKGSDLPQLGFYAALAGYLLLQVLITYLGHL